MEPLGWFRCLLWPEWTTSVHLILINSVYVSDLDVMYGNVKPLKKWGAEMGMTDASMEGFISCKWQIQCYIANQFKTMLQDYYQQPGPAAVHVSDSGSSEASVNRTRHTHMLGDNQPPPASWGYENLLLSSWGVGISIQFHSFSSAIQALQTIVWSLQEQWAWKGCDWSGSVPRSQANSLMGAQPPSLLSVQESDFGSLSGDSSGDSSGETAARFGTGSVQITPVCSQQHKQTSLPETLLQHA